MSEAPIQSDAPDGLFRSTANDAECHADQRVVGGRLGRPLVGVVPVDLVADGPGLGPDLGDVDDADGECLDRLTGGASCAAMPKMAPTSKPLPEVTAAGAVSVIVWPGWI